MTLTLEDRQVNRLGVDLSGCTSVEEALTVADLNWGLAVHEANSITIHSEDGDIQTHIPGGRLVMRDDNHTTLGVVGHRYEPVDNRNVFALADYFLGQGAKFKSGGYLDHGRKAFMRMSVPDGEVSLLSGKDLVKFDVVIRASHDGTGNVTAGIEGTRLICTNGMVAQMVGIPHVFNVRHTANVMTRFTEAEQILSGAIRYVRGFTAAAQHMLDTPMSRDEFKAFIDALYPAPDAESKRAVSIWENRRSELLALFSLSETNDLGRDTAWAGYNSITEFLDWSAPIRSMDGSDLATVRARRQFDHTTQDIKDHAFALVTA